MYVGQDSFYLALANFRWSFIMWNTFEKKKKNAKLWHDVSNERTINTNKRAIHLVRASQKEILKFLLNKTKEFKILPQLLENKGEQIHLSRCVHFMFWHVFLTPPLGSYTLLLKRMAI